MRIPFGRSARRSLMKIGLCSACSGGGAGAKTSRRTTRPVVTSAHAISVAARTFLYVSETSSPFFRRNHLGTHPRAYRILRKNACVHEKSVNAEPANPQLRSQQLRSVPSGALAALATVDTARPWPDQDLRSLGARTETSRRCGPAKPRAAGLLSTCS